jgi:hypothetical protein
MKKNKGKIQKGVAKKPLVNVPEDKVFWCTDGQIFRNIKDLSEGLSNMSDETFAYHSNAEKHDFSNWLMDVLGEVELANELAKPITRQEADGVTQSMVLLFNLM